MSLYSSTEVSLELCRDPWATHRRAPVSAENPHPNCVGGDGGHFSIDHERAYQWPKSLVPPLGADRESPQHDGRVSVGRHGRSGRERAPATTTTGTSVDDDGGRLAYRTDACRCTSAAAGDFAGHGRGRTRSRACQAVAQRCRNSAICASVTSAGDRRCRSKIF